MRDAARREIQGLQSSIEREQEEVRIALEGRMEEADAVLEASTRLGTKAGPSGVGGADPGSLVAASVVGFGIDEDARAMMMHLGAEEDHHGLLTQAQERELRQRSTRSLWHIARREQELVARARSLAEHETSFSQIQEGTGIRSVDEMVSAFLAAEDRHFALVGLLHTAQKEIEDLELDCAELQASCVFAEGRGGTAARARQRLFASLELQTGRLLQKAGASSDRHDRALRTLETVRPITQSILHKLGSSSEAADATQGLASERAFLALLAVVELRVEELVRSLAALGQAPGAPQDRARLSEDVGTADGRVGGMSTLTTWTPSSATAAASDARMAPTHATMVINLDSLATPVGGLGAGEGAMRADGVLLAVPAAIPLVGDIVLPGLDTADPNTGREADATPVDLRELRERMGLRR